MTLIWMKYIINLFNFIILLAKLHRLASFLKQIYGNIINNTLGKPSLR